MQKDDFIHSVFVDELTQSLFVGTNNSNLNQLSLQSQKVIKKYQNLGIGDIIYTSSFNNLLFVGGDNYLFTIINITERRIIMIAPVETPMRGIYSSQFTIINWSNNPTVALTVCGSKP